MTSKNGIPKKNAPTDNTDDGWAMVKKSIKPLKNNNNKKVHIHAHRQQQKTPYNQKENKKQLKNQISESKFKQLLTNLHLGSSVSDSVDMGKKSDDLAVGDTSHINKSHARKLKSGHIPIDSKIDLHAMDKNKAFNEVRYFINTALLNKHKTILIITGKGEGILQKNVPKWLNSKEFQSHILYIDFAHRKHGGSGAYYVILKK